MTGRLFLALLWLAASTAAEARRHNSRCVLAEPPALPGHLLAEFTTHFKARNVRRAANVRLAASRLQGVIIPPGGMLSYNKSVGPRTESTGFLPAPTINRGREIDTPGGGVCQPSSTVHGAALMAGLRIEERHPHTWLSKYIAPGYDAAVVYGLKDLVLRNPYPFAVRLDVEVGEKHMTVRIVGEMSRPGWVEMQVSRVKQIEFRTQVKVDPTLHPTDMLIMNAGIPGGRYERTRTFRTPGVAPRRQKMSRDVYYPRDAQVRIGPNDDPTPTSSHASR